MQGASETIAEVTGVRPHTCPWWSPEVPLVQEVMSVHAALANDVGFTLDLASLPSRVAEGVRVYTIALARSRNERDARKAQERRDKRGGADV